MTDYQNKRKQQEINYKITMLNDARKALRQELSQIDTSISLLQEQRLEIGTGGLK